MKDEINTQYDFSYVEKAALVQDAENADPHTKKASLLLGVPESEITPEMRRLGKIANFGEHCGMGAYRMGKSFE
jgi:DNA polymerase I-like protein with 3'-5' exonuclease and polymerase domains